MRKTRQEISEYRKHKKNIKRENVQPKVDNKVPLLDIDAYYNISNLQKKTAILSEIFEQNIKLIQRINVIYRTHGKIDNSKPKSTAQSKSNMDYIVRRNKIIYKENLKLLSKLIYAKPKIDCKKTEKDQKKHDDWLILMSKHPESYKDKYKMKNREHDPLVAHTVKHIRIKKSKCFMDVRDVTANKSLGRLTIELYDGVVPETAKNFMDLCNGRENVFNYTGAPFFRIVPGAFCLGGHVEHSNGAGGTSAFPGQRYFQDENFALSHSVPGVLSTYNYKNNENASQFLITFKPLKVLDGRYVAFGRVIRGFDCLRLIEDNGFPTGKPKHNIIVEECGELPQT